LNITERIYVKLSTSYDNLNQMLNFDILSYFSMVLSCYPRNSNKL